MILLYHAPRSRSSRVIWLLEELGVPYKIKLTSIVLAMGRARRRPTATREFIHSRKYPRSSTTVLSSTSPLASLSILPMRSRRLESDRWWGTRSARITCAGSSFIRRFSNPRQRRACAAGTKSRRPVSANSRKSRVRSRGRSRRGLYSRRRIFSGGRSVWFDLPVPQGQPVSRAQMLRRLRCAADRASGVHPRDREGQRLMPRRLMTPSTPRTPSPFQTTGSGQVAAQTDTLVARKGTHRSNTRRADCW